MKKIMMIAALMVAAVSAKAQFEPGTFSLQPKAGFVLSTVTGDGTSFKPGFTAGLEAQYQINNWFGLSAGALYTTAGYKVKDDGDYKLNTGYVNIPVMAKFYVTKGLSLNAGLQLGFMTTATAKSPLGDADCKDLCNKTDFSIPLGAAYEIGDFVIDARYNLGLTNVGKDVGKNKNSVIMLTLGYKIPF